MGQTGSKPREAVLIDDLKLGTCFKNVVNGGDGPYNYCRKVIKNTYRRKNKYYELETDRGRLYMSEGTLYKKCKCPKTRKKKRAAKI